MSGVLVSVPEKAGEVKGNGAGEVSCELRSALLVGAGKPRRVT